LDQLYAIDDRIVTCGGGSSATDLFLRLISERFGPVMSHSVLNMCLHPVHRSEEEAQQSSRAASIGTRNRKLLQILRYMEENIEELFSLDDLADRFKVSRRQIERLFLTHVKATPKQYLTDLRLRRGRMLLAETDMKVADIASSCGFESTNHFSRRFREKYGVSPHKFQSAGRG
jgi:transcriptional regulator GlxA family with amidase domain